MNTETLQKVVGIFKQIQSTSSKNEKKAILEENKDFNEFVDVLSFLYNPYILTGIRHKKLVKFAHFKSDNVKQFGDLFEAMNYISKHNTGRDEDVQAIANFINQHEGEVHDFLQDLFTKDFKCGITATTINQVFGKNFIPKFDVMLAEKFQDYYDKITGEFFVTLKLDGIRCIVVKEDEVIKFFTRKGQPIEGLVELHEEFQNLPDGWVYDGELLLANDKGLSRKELFRKTQSAVRKDGEKRNIEFHMFDLLPVKEFRKGKSEFTYKQRRGILESLSVFNLNNTRFIKKLPLLYYGSDINVVFDLLEQVTNDGHEGLMINLADGYYETKRTSNLLKVKKMKSADLRVIDVEEGTGKNKGKLGKVVVDYKGYAVGVGSGFTDEDREYYWKNPEEILGKIIEVQYFEESQNEDGGISLRLPIFKCVRFDKDEPSYH
jgi:DNA ligase 1